MDESSLEHIIRVAEAIDRFGALTIGLAVFMFFAIVAITIVFMQQKKMATSRDNNFEKVFDQLVESAFKTYHSEVVPESISATSAVQDHLKTAAAITKADRVSVYAFHDGQRMLNGRHMVKFSCWAEFATLPRFVHIDTHKDIQASRIQQMCDALLKDHQWEALSESVLVGTELEVWKEQMQTKSVFARSIYSADGVIIGFVLMEYLLQPIEPTWIEKTRDEIKRLSDVLSLALDIEMK